jgi:hypothetical protein
LSHPADFKSLPLTEWTEVLSSERITGGLLEPPITLTSTPYRPALDMKLFHA